MESIGHGSKSAAHHTGYTGLLIQACHCSIGDGEVLAPRNVLKFVYLRPCYTGFLQDVFAQFAGVILT